MSAWDRVITSAPVNHQAAKDLSAGGEGDLRLPAHLADNLFDGPPSVAKAPKHKLEDPNFDDLMGKRFGRLVVVGYVGPATTKSGKKARNGVAWAVRCDCSLYAIQRSKTLKRGHATKCQRCEYDEKVRAGFGRPDLPKSNGRRAA